ncbi:MAG TPA: DUF2784 domain-containing protein [Sphingobacteriaceae bacterium]|nr:DUF2784 domain-containing protein [Sphingobacteriaceae bacterium]
MDKYIYLFLTQLTVIIHLLFILFVIAGGFFAHKKRWIKIIHLCAVAWAVYVELSGMICPLTYLENYFASHARLATYKEDFVTRYLIPVIYQDNLTPNIQLILAGVVIFINIIAYSIRWKQKPQ